MVAALRNSDEQALYQITRLYKGLARNLIRWLPADCFEDVFQETLLRAWNKRRLFDPDRGGFRSWFFAIFRRKAVDFMRKQRRAVERHERGEALRDTAGFRELRAGAAGVLRDDRGALSDLQWRVFLADLDTFPDKLSARELAVMLASTESSIRVQRSKACARLVELGLPDLRVLRRAGSDGKGASE